MSGIFPQGVTVKTNYRQSVAVVLGNSIVANGMQGGFENTRSIVGHANRLLGGPWTIANEAGFSGERIDQLTARWSTEVTPYKAGTVFFEGGINNFGQGQSAETTFQQLLVAFNLAVTAGQRFLHIFTGVALSGSQSQQRAKFIAYCMQYAKQQSNYEFIDCSTPMLDFNNTPINLANGVVKSADTPDQLHPSGFGAYEIAIKAMVPYFQTRGYPKTSILSPYGNDGAGAGDGSSNMFLNGLVGSAGANWQAYLLNNPGSRTATTSVIDMGSSGLQSTIPGRIFQAVWTGVTAPSDGDLMITGNLYDAASGILPYSGKTYSLRFYCKATSTGGVIHELSARAIMYRWDYGQVFFDIVNNNCFDTSGGGLSTHSMNVNSYEGIFQTDNFLVPAGVDQGHFFWGVGLKAAPGAVVTVQAGAAQVREILTI